MKRVDRRRRKGNGTIIFNLKIANKSDSDGTHH